MSTQSITRSQDKKGAEYRLNAMQTALLRGWFINMTFFSAAQARRLGFDYSTEELERFAGNWYSQPAATFQ